MLLSFFRPAKAKTRNRLTKVILPVSPNGVKLPPAAQGTAGFRVPHGTPPTWIPENTKTQTVSRQIKFETRHGFHSVCDSLHMSARMKGVLRPQ
jgi:hypothetical protein